MDNEKQLFTDHICYLQYELLDLYLLLTNPVAADAIVLNVAFLI